MKTVDFRRIFRIGEDGIYFDGGEILYKDLIERAKNIGVTAGASTPDDIINDVIKELEKI